MIHLISKDYYLAHRGNGELKKILVPEAKFPNISSQFFMTDSGECFMYLQVLGVLVVSGDSKLDETVLTEELNGSRWFIEKYDNPDSKLTTNYINAFPEITIYYNPNLYWLGDYNGWIRVWNTLSKEDFIFYKTSHNQYTLHSNPKSYMCRIVTGSKAKFPIDLEKVKEYNILIKDILEWM